MHLNNTWKHIRRSPYQAITAILIVTFTLYIAALFILASFSSYKILKYFETKPQVTAFFKDKTGKNEIDDLGKLLKLTGKVSSMKYISKEEALSIYKEQNKKDPLLLEMVTSDILPASLEISTGNLVDLKDIYETIKRQPIVEEVVYQKDVIDSLNAWSNGIKRIGIEFLLFLSLTSTLVVLNVIGMKIALRKEEIEILKLMGATNWYVRWPFILEGTLYGAIGGFFAWAITYFRVWQATPFLSSFLKGIPLFPFSVATMAIILGILLGCGLVIGAVGSFIAVKRYLK